MGCGSTFVNLLLFLVSQIWRTRLYWLIKVCNRCLDLKRNNVDVAVWIEWYRFAFFKKDSAPPFPPAFPISSSLRRNINRATFLWKVVLVPLFSKNGFGGSPPSINRLDFELQRIYRFGECPSPFTNEICFDPRSFLGGKYLPALRGRKVVAAHIASQQFLQWDKDFSVSFLYFLGLLVSVFAFSPRNPRQHCTPALLTLRSNVNYFSGLSVLF